MRRARCGIARCAWVVALASVALGVAPAPAIASYEEIVVPDGGTLAGTVRFVGTPPKLEPLAVTRHREVCGKGTPSEALVVGPDRGVKGSVIRIEGVRRGKRKTAEVVIDSVNCLFVPHVAGTSVGARVRVKNSDRVLHNPHGVEGSGGPDMVPTPPALGTPRGVRGRTRGVRGRTRGARGVPRFTGTFQVSVFNVALPHKEQIVDITRRLTTPGVIRITCDPHPHMLGWLVVHDSPYVATTDERGAYRIDGIPPGTYRVTMWHEGFRRRRTGADGRPVYDHPRTVARTVTIAPRATATADFELRSWGAPKWPPKPPNARERPGGPGPLLDSPIRSRPLRSWGASIVSP
ncbi:MAG: carboxypeptidase regulatory-like domain-containing protein [Candidatus Rokubacteria bacterium]|nr:carboxypeptidase regulatory-like domain-containing protein [Candidatus Rokubacteria bacterium]